jgi:23S rRNA (cytosine1962-C5)-methyltransferase
MAKRKSLNLQRENYYLVFGEVDQLPGLTILLLNQVILIQYHAYFWEPYLEFLITNLTRKLPQIQSVYSQKRVVGENKTKPQHVWGDITDRFQVKESDISFNIRFDDNYDIGLYSDMSSFREKLKTLFKENFTCLNLFAYTGAFSLMALKNKMRTYSVDVSKKYLLWLEENITSNKFAADLHQSITKSCDKYIQRALDEKKNFDLIISDPPSFSSDGKKSKSSFDFYQENLDHLISLLSEKGHLVLFLNTHKIERKKFKKMLTDKIQTQPQIKLIQELYLDQDCAIMKKFPESDYLKGYVLKKN